jgi:endogenous inhibitor of DNA gyrase (YacG/DUF329 family)
MRSLLGFFADVILGGRCPYCQNRVFPKDHCAHRYVCTARPERITR